jgi:hypothetical protein
MADSDAPPPNDDVLFVHSANEEGNGLRVIRKRTDRIELGELRNVEEGKPITGDLVKLHKRAESDRLFNVETVLARDEHTPKLAAGHGPAQIATNRYRKNWDDIFGRVDAIEDAIDVGEVIDSVPENKGNLN